MNEILRGSGKYDRKLLDVLDHTHNSMTGKHKRSFPKNALSFQSFFLGVLSERVCALLGRGLERQIEIMQAERVRRGHR